MPTALVIEDDDGIRAVVSMTLADEGFEVVEVDAAEEGLVQLGARGPDLILVDLMLGGMSGLDFVSAARRATSAPILVVSALRDNPTIVAALEDGADDYVTKPFEVDVLAARCRALIRRAGQATPSAEEVVVLDRERSLVLRESAGMLTLAGEEVHLTKTEFRLLADLAARPGWVLSRAQLLDHIWDVRDWSGDERVVDVHVRRLRTKIEEDPADPRLLVTVRGQGYRLDAR